MGVHEIGVKKVDGKHQCDKPETVVNGGDQVFWKPDALPVFFKRSPFEQPQPYKPNTTSTIKRGVFKKGDKFEASLTPGGEMIGQIVIRDP